MTVSENGLSKDSPKTAASSAKVSIHSTNKKKKKTKHTQSNQSGQMECDYPKLNDNFILPTKQQVQPNQKNIDKYILQLNLLNMDSYAVKELQASTIAWHIAKHPDKAHKPSQQRELLLQSIKTIRHDLLYPLMTDPQKAPQLCQTAQEMAINLVFEKPENFQQYSKEQTFVYIRYLQKIDRLLPPEIHINKDSSKENLLAYIAEVMVQTANDKKIKQESVSNTDTLKLDVKTSSEYINKIEYDSLKFLSNKNLENILHTWQEFKKVKKSIAMSC